MGMFGEGMAKKHLIMKEIRDVEFKLFPPPPPLMDSSNDRDGMET